MGLQVWPRSKDTLLTIEMSIISQARVHSTYAAISRSCWQFFGTPVGRYITSLHHEAQPLQRGNTMRYFVAFVMMCDVNDCTWGQHQLDSSITIMHPPILCFLFRFSWLNTVFPWFIRLPTPPTWIRAILGYSPSLKSCWNEPDLNREKTLCGM